VGAISEKDQERIDTANYAGTTLIGKLGVERAFEDELHGETGYQQLLVNAQGRRVERIGLTAPELQRRAPVSGNDLYLAVDAGVQKVAEEALAGQRAAVVAIDPHNGDIIAFVSTPRCRRTSTSRSMTAPCAASTRRDPRSSRLSRSPRSSTASSAPRTRACAAARSSCRARASGSATGRRAATAP
jgi:cell division protein FtsI/penicillin-binding protein 2